MHGRGHMAVKQGSSSGNGKKEKMAEAFSSRNRKTL